MIYQEQWAHIAPISLNYNIQLLFCLLSDEGNTISSLAKSSMASFRFFWNQKESISQPQYHTLKRKYLILIRGMQSLLVWNKIYFCQVQFIFLCGWTLYSTNKLSSIFSRCIFSLEEDCPLLMKRGLSFGKNFRLEYGITGNGATRVLFFFFEVFS